MVQGPKLADGLRVSTHPDGVVVLDTRCGHIFTANAVGARIVALLGENHDLESIADQIAAEFQAPRNQVTDDLHRFIDTMRARNLLEDHAAHA